MIPSQGYENALLKMMGKAIGKNNNVSKQIKGQIMEFPIWVFPSLKLESNG